MRTGIFLLVLLLVLLGGCGKSNQVPGSAGQPPAAGKPDKQPIVDVRAAKPEEVVKSYLEAIGGSDYRKAAGCLEHPKALVWPRGRRAGPGGAPGGGAPRPAANSPAKVVTAYLAAIGRSDYRRAAGYLEHPQAAVWPGVGLLEETFSAKVPPDVVRLSQIGAGPTLPVSARGDEVCCLARGHVAPGREAYRWGIGQEDDWQFAFWLIKRDGGWRLARGMPLAQEPAGNHQGGRDAAEIRRAWESKQLAGYLEGGNNPFRNVVSRVPAVAERGREYKLAFDLGLPRALSFMQEVDVAFFTEPGTEKYPYSYESVLSSSCYGVGHLDQTVEINPEMPPGKYRLYLALGTKPLLYWAIPPYVVTVK
jgi:hypothetical protein